MDLPIKQVSKGQGLATQVKIEPDAKVMQADFGSQASLKASELMWPFPSQSKSVEQFVVDGFDDLPQTSQPATPLLGPLLLASLMGRTDDFSPIALAPLGVRLISGEALIADIDTHSLGPNAWQSLLRVSACRKERLGQSLIMGAR